MGSPEGAQEVALRTGWEQVFPDGAGPGDGAGDHNAGGKDVADTQPRPPGLQPGSRQMRGRTQPPPQSLGSLRAG